MHDNAQQYSFRNWKCLGHSWRGLNAKATSWLPNADSVMISEPPANPILSESPPVR
jgi:hypothetical protein